MERGFDHTGGFKELLLGSYDWSLSHGVLCSQVWPQNALSLMSVTALCTGGPQWVCALEPTNVKQHYHRNKVFHSEHVISLYSSQHWILHKHDCLIWPFSSPQMPISKSLISPLLLKIFERKFTAAITFWQLQSIALALLLLLLLRADTYYMLPVTKILGMII